MRWFKERGNQSSIGTTVNSSLRTALLTGIHLSFMQNMENPLWGRILSEDSEKIRDYEEVIENQIGDNQNWVDGKEIELNNLIPYIMPSAKKLPLIP